MRKLFFAILTIVSLNVFVYAGDKPFEGKIQFTMEVSGEGANMMGAFMPESYDYYLRNNDVLIKVNGGMAAGMMGDVLLKGDQGAGYMIKHAEKTIYKLPSNEEATEEATPEITKLDEVETILGYDCQKYKVTTGDITQYVWVAKDLKIQLPKKGKVPGAGGNIFINGLDGIPLKIKSNAMGYTIVMTAQEVSEEKVDKSLFQLPSDYKVTDFDPSSLMGF